jgi:ubiquinone/menaquinone biosynthesis C-methylase UbiE
MPEHRCPVWIGYLIASPLRKLIHNPDKILLPYITNGMKVLDIGSAMGFFSIPMAKMVGAKGKVICIDVQQKMLDELQKRSLRAGSFDNMEFRLCSSISLGIYNIKDEIDFALAFAVLHEVKNVSALFKEVNRALKKNGKILIAEPQGHVNGSHFHKILNSAAENGFILLNQPKISKCWTAFIEKK